ncbi:uncharacterized protein [Miscanthus floridulus]|uniref:uncharacterized protein n=1 Tax=Miscanthus floridulus TaxID=154761 RepID=UPI0034593D26
MLMAVQKLLRYFTDHEVVVITSYSLKDIVRNRDAIGRFSKWALELMGHDIRYIPCTTIKSQALMDFIAEWMEAQLPTPDVTHEYWTMYFDGSVMAPSSGARVVLISPDGSRLRYAIRLHFLASNNTVEYEALVNELCIAIELGATRLYIRGDSELVVDQVIKESSCKSPLMAAYCQEVHKPKDKFQGIELHHIPRKDNDATVFLAKFIARRDPSPSGVFINNLHELSTCILEGLIQTRPDAKPTLKGFNPSASMMTSPADIAVLALDQTNWRASLLTYLLKEVLPPKRTEARWIARRAKTFIAIGDELYK